jgi:oligosaccharide reducing-end xylanase
MKISQARLTGCLLFLSVGLAASPENKPAFESGHYRNLFAEHLGKSEAELDAKLSIVWQQFTAGDPATQRLFYTTADQTTYIPDIKHADVRTEGQSYGMMLAVQMNQQAEFNRLWKWTKDHMFHREGKYAGYYAWHCRYDGTQIDAGPASDGEEWFVMTLFFAAHRWGNGEGIFNYEAEAQTLLRHMLHNNEGGAAGSVTSMFDCKEKQIVFVPHAPGNAFSDPSYHLPAFYELWARWAADLADRTFMADAAQVSRRHFHAAAHPVTGLMPDYSNFDGTPYPRGNHQHFLFDAYRTIGNVALDYSWFGRDSWQTAPTTSRSTESRSPKNSRPAFSPWRRWADLRPPVPTLSSSFSACGTCRFLPVKSVTTTDCFTSSVSCKSAAAIRFTAHRINNCQNPPK